MYSDLRNKNYSKSLIASLILLLTRRNSFAEFRALTKNRQRISALCDEFVETHNLSYFHSSYDDVQSALPGYYIFIQSHKGEQIYGVSETESDDYNLYIAIGPNGRYFPCLKSLTAD